MKIVIVAVNLGNFKAYRVSEDTFGIESPSIDLIKSYDVKKYRMRISEKARDQAGRFYRGGGTGATEAGFGEPHGIKLETERRLIKQLAEDISALIIEEKCDKWYLAAGKNINSRIVDSLDPILKEKLRRNITADLTRTDKVKIMGYFE